MGCKGEIDEVAPEVLVLLGEFFNVFDKSAHSGPQGPGASDDDTLEYFHVSWKHENTLDFVLTRFLNANRHPLRSKAL